MWTAKRILLLLGSLTLFVLGFFVYSHFLGDIDVLPLLPGEYTATDPDEPYTPPPIQDTMSTADRRLRMGFGLDCPEIQRSIKVDVKKNNMTFATNEVSFQPDGRVRFKPFSIVLFGKEDHQTGFPEANTVRSEEAYLTFDRPIGSLTDIANRKIMGAELRGAITVINNRRTQQTSDDIEVYIVNGPLYYHETKSLIWTESFVKLLDKQSQPHPTQVTAIGLDIHLSRDVTLSGQHRPAPPKGAKKGNVSGIEQVVLRGNVDMRLHIDGKTGFLAGSQDPTRVAQNGGEPSGQKALEGSYLTIKTVGPFTYDVAKDLAVFESPPANPNPAKPRPFPSDQVEVIRIHKQGEGKLTDQLVCDRLELQFRRKAAAVPNLARREQELGDREIQSARAAARAGHEVTLSLDTENLNAHGSELVYLAPTDEQGAQTVLKGEPMTAVKDAHQIRARELRLVAANKRGEGQHAYARGPGQIDLVDQNSPAKALQYHAVWTQSLRVVKDKEGERVFDRLTFDGQAGFIDDAHKQELHADKLEVWLEPAEREGLNDPNKDKKHRAGDAPRQQPHKLEAVGKVRVRSPELVVKECDHLIVRFKDGVAPRLPEAAPGVAAAHVSQRAPSADAEALPAIRLQAPQAAPAPAGTGARVIVHSPPAVAAVAARPVEDGVGGQRGLSRNPIELTARYVTVDVTRAGKQHEMQEVLTRGDVYVHQKPSSEKNNGVEIRGETLNLLHHLEGDTLIVFGDSRGPAELRLGEMVLVGPKVTIDQRLNVAEVKGIGAMHLPSDRDFEGGKPGRPGTKLTIHWTKEMFFDGQMGVFQGGVQAYQDSASMRCQALQVSLDQAVSFKEGQQNGQGAKVNNLLCHGQVDIADTKRDERDQLVRFERLVARQLTMDNQQGPANAAGPGRVYILQHGSVAATSAAKPGAAPPPAEKRLHLTRVDFDGRLYSTKKGNNREARFYDNVKVFHVPADDHSARLDPDNLPKGGLYLESEQLTVLSVGTPPGSGGKSQTYMQADKNVTFRTDKFYGSAEKVTYDQSRELVTFEGGGTNLVTLYETVGRGVTPKMTRMQRLVYNRQTGEFSSSGLQIIEAKDR